MELFNKNGRQYVRLDDDVSFQVLRTNPKLTTNTKLVYDGENLFMDAYPAAPILTTMEYKHHRVWKTGLFNRDIRNFLLGSNTTAYEVGQNVRDTIVLDNFDDQYENMYWSGVESVNSDMYPQEMGCIAPLYLRKKRPNYFVVFKIDTPANTNTSSKVNDTNFKFNDDVKKRMSIVKAFDLREGTPLGNYIKRYVEQRDFKYDQSIYVNFSSHEIYYYGIDKSSGVLTQKVENIENQLLNNDNTIQKMDDWITSGFERNNLIFPYIINLEFLFDDKNIQEYKFARYFGMYCNDIDLYDLDVDYCIKHDKSNTTTISTKWGSEDEVTMDSDKFYYIKDKYNNIYSAKNNKVAGMYDIPGLVSENNFTGYEPSTVSTYAERMEGVGKAFMMFEIVKPLEVQDRISIVNTIYNKTDDGGSEPGGYEAYDTLGTFVATNQFGPGEFYENRFSCKGTLEDMAKALAGCIRTCNTDEFKWMTAFNIGNKVVIRAQYPGSNLNRLFDLSLDDISRLKIKKITDYFDGGTDILGCMFKIYTSDRDMFIDETGRDRDSDRYLKCGIGRTNSKVQAIMPYITDDNKIDDVYSIIVTDSYGPYVNVSNTDQVEIVDLFYAKLGVLSFFPVRDFDFDTVYSSYGEYGVMRNELDTNLQYSNSGTSGDNMNYTIPYGRFFHQDGKEIDTEYDYYFENLIPELSTVNKTVPFINKWGYIDEERDSCENPYRLNTSKVFDACNFSANTFMQRGDIMEYTHSMPYYINNGYSDNNDSKNEYQYIIVDSSLWNTSLSAWEDYFSKKTSDGKDPFDKLFGDTSSGYFKNKRFNKKYSRFLTGDSVSRSSTLFRGVKFEITELENGKETHTGKYNDYKFAFVYVPFVETDTEKIEKDPHTVHFIKNDEFKFIVGMVFFNVASFHAGEDSQISSLSNFDFNKTFVYAATMGYDNLAYAASISHGGGENEQGADINYDTGGSDQEDNPYYPTPTPSDDTVPNHNGDNTAGGESNYYSGDTTYNSGEGSSSSSSTVTEPDEEPTPEPEPVLPTDIDAQTFNLPVSSYTEDGQPKVAGDVILYSNGGYRVLTEEGSSSPSNAPSLFAAPRLNRGSSSIPFIEDIMIKGLTENVTGVSLNGDDYEFGDEEIVKDVDGNYGTYSYVRIPASKFNSASDYDVYVNYEDGVTSNNSVTVSLPFMYDLTKGNLRLYENGRYRYWSLDEDDTIKSTNGTLIPNLSEYGNVHIYIGFPKYGNFNFENSETVNDNGNVVELKYISILDASSFNSLTKTSVVVKNSNDETVKSVPIEVYRSNVTIEFKFDTITIDRSIDKSFLKQLAYPEIYNYITVTDENGKTVGYNHRLMDFYIGNYKIGSTAYSGDAVSIVKEDSQYKCGWKFKDCTWKKDAYDTIHVSYGANTDCAQMMVQIVDGTPGNVPIRGFKPVDNIGSIDFIEGLTYPIGQFIHHYPEDAIYSNTPTYNNYGLDPDMITWTKEISDSETGRKPQNWEEFYNDQMITMLNDGKCRLHYGWYGNGDSNKSDLATFGGQLTINIIPNRINYELEDGEMKFYENGKYRIGDGPLKDSRLNIPSTTFNLSINLYKEFSPYTKTGTTIYEFSDSQADSNGRYVVIKSEDSIVEYVGEGVANFEPKPFAYPGVHKMYLNVEGRKYSDFVKLIVTDRNFNLSFNTDVITIDRSNEKSFINQMSTYYKGQAIVDYLNIPTNSQIRFYDFYIYAYLNSFKRDGTGRSIKEINGNAITMSPTWMRDSTWKKNQEDKIYIKYGYLGIDKDSPEPETMCNGNYLTVRTSDSNPSIVYLRGITDSRYNHTFNVNQVYTLRDMFGFYPGDATNFSLDMSKFDIKDYDTSALKFTKLMDTPTTWSEFYDSYIQVTVLKKGLFDCYISWSSGDTIGGKYLIKLRGVTDGTGKKQSSSGSQTSPTPTPDEGTSGGQSSDKPKKGPSLSAYASSRARAIEYLPSRGNMRIYDDSSYRFVSGDETEQQTYIPIGKLVGETGGYQEPEVRNLPVDITIPKVNFNNTDVQLSGSESVYDADKNENVFRKYADIPLTQICANYGEHTFQISYTDNYDGKTTRASIYVTTLFEYNFADGHLRIYDNGYCRIVPYSEVNGESSGTPSMQEKFFYSKINLDTFERCYLNSSPLTFDNNEDVIELHDSSDYESYTLDFFSSINSMTNIRNTTNASTVLKSGTEYLTKQPFTIETGSAYYGSTHDCIYLGSNGKESKLIINLSDSGKVNAEKIIVNCKKRSGSENENAVLIINGVGPYSPIDYATSSGTFNQPADLTFDVSHDEPLESIILECTASILIDRITVVKYHNAEEESAPVNHGYFDITPYNFNGYLWPKTITIKANTSLYSYGYVTISPSDSRINLSFIKDEITLDRSNKYPIKTQLKAQGGETMFDFLKIDVGDDVDYIESDTGDILDSIKDNISFYIDRYSPGATQYAGSSISIDGYGEISHCTWKKDAVDVIRVKYAGRTYDTTMNIRIIQTTDDVYIRRMNCNIIRGLNMGNTYTLRDFVSFIPEDVVNDDKYFKHMEIVHHAPSWSSLNNTMDFQFITNSDYVTRTPETLAPENAPNNWQEFWNWITVTPIKTGEFRLYYLFRTDIGGGGGEVTVRIK